MKYLLITTVILLLFSLISKSLFAEKRDVLINVSSTSDGCCPGAPQYNPPSLCPTGYQPCGEPGPCATACCNSQRCIQPYYFTVQLVNEATGQLGNCQLVEFNIDHHSAFEITLQFTLDDEINWIPVIRDISVGLEKTSITQVITSYE